jgi:hypothetical protein
LKRPIPPCCYTLTDHPLGKPGNRMTTVSKTPTAVRSVLELLNF